MQIRTALNQATKLLTDKKILSAHLDAELLLLFVLKKTKEFIYAHPEIELSSAQLQKFNTLISKRAQHIPVAYLTHQQGFFGLDFWVNQNVLIPRPESEILVEQTLKLISQFFKHKKVVLADIGTGSGCLAISLAKNLTQAQIYAVDISTTALYVARKNSRLNHVQAKIKFHLGDLLDPIKNKACNIILANLPYVPQTYAKKLNQFYNQGLKYEPSSALYSGADGLDHYRRFFGQIKNLKSRPRFVLIEIDSSQVVKLKKIILQNLPQAKIEVIQDLNKKDRFLQINLF